MSNYLEYDRLTALMALAILPSASEERNILPDAIALTQSIRLGSEPQFSACPPLVNWFPMSQLRVPQRRRLGHDRLISPSTKELCAR